MIVIRLLVGHDEVLSCCAKGAGASLPSEVSRLFFQRGSQLGQHHHAAFCTKLPFSDAAYRRASFSVSDLSTPFRLNGSIFIDLMTTTEAG